MILCAQVVGVYRSYVSSAVSSRCGFHVETHKAILLQHPVDESILLACWSNLSVYCNKLRYRNHKLLYQPEFVEVNPQFSSDHSSDDRILTHHMNLHVSWLHSPKSFILQDWLVCFMLIYAKQHLQNRPYGLPEPALWHYASVKVKSPLWISAENASLSVLGHCFPRPGWVCNSLLPHGWCYCTTALLFFLQIVPDAPAPSIRCLFRTKPLTDGVSFINPPL